MKSYLGTIVLIGFAGVAVFGAFAMGHDGSHDSGCIAATAKGVTCPETAGPFSDAAFHLNAVKGFSQATPSGSLAFLSLILILSLALFNRLKSVFLVYAGTASPAYVIRSEILNGLALPLRFKITDWFSLHENSPQFALAPR